MGWAGAPRKINDDKIKSRCKQTKNDGLDAGSRGIRGGMYGGTRYGM